MELFKLFGTIAVNNSEANQGIDETTDKAEDAAGKVKDLGDEGDRTEGKLGKAFSKMGSAAVAVGKTIATGLAVASTAVVAVGKAAISSYADYEQLVGGVETLFDESSATVIANAQNAYKTAGMSANEYMEIVTSFSASLLQSLGGDTKAAADKADMAITDMSDNANKMGTSIEMIQNAYNGFAKQNYTMLDNLKLGYLELYYVQNGKVFKALSRYRADNLAGRTFVVPTLDFYVYWHTDGSVNNFYGFSIDSVTMTDDAALTGTEVSSLPAYNTVQTSDITTVQTAHNPYLNASNMLWHYTHTVPDNFVGKKTFKVGAVTVVDSNDSLYRYTNYENTLDCIKEKLIKRLGGHIRIRKVDGIKYLDYLADYPVTSDQVIEFGRNLLDFSQTLDAQDIATAIIPLGAKLEESTIEALDERLTIKSVNNDCDFIFNQAAVDTFGWVFKTVTFDAVTVPSNLKRKGEEYLSSVQFESLVLDVTAVDLNNVNVDISRIHLLDRVRVKSEPHGLDSFFPVTKLTISLEKPESDKIVLGSENAKVTMTGSNTSTKTDIMERIENIPSESSILKEAIDNATALINSATHGFVVTTANEQLIMDTNDTETASKVWRWNLNGLGYSNTGYKGTYTTAITMDGQIVGERLVGGSVSAEKLSVEYKYSVERAIELAEINANDATDNKLKSYYTKTQVTTAIKNSADSVLISAKEEAVEYTDSRLTAYATKAEIKVKTDSIESTVSKKLNSSEFTTKLTQNYSYVRIAWNKCSQYIQFENSSLNIYDYNNYKLMSLNSSGSWFYREGSTIGMIGTNQWSGDSSYKGLVFDLENTASYMCWAAKDSNNASSYTVKLI